MRSRYEMSLFAIFEGYLYREKPLQSSMGVEGRNKGDTFDLQIVNGHTSSDQRKITNRNNDYSESNSSDKMCPITNRNTRDKYLLNNIQFSYLYSFHSVEDSCFQKPYFHCCLHCFPLDSH